jgi:hypothetical protein
MLELPIYYSFARSGGTLLNRCLGCIRQNLVLSEVNPHGGVVAVEKQARDWFGLLDQREYEALLPRSYPEKILVVLKKALERGKHLIVRDWCVINFLAAAGVSQAKYEPSGLLEQPLYLESVGLRLRPIVFARRAASVYASKIFASVALEVFAGAYLAFAKSVCTLPVFHYEDFCADPPTALLGICRALSVAYDPAFVHHFAEFDNCTGDNTINRANRTAPVHLEHIAQLSPARSDPRYVAAFQDPSCREADRLLGYENEP